MLIYGNFWISMVCSVNENCVIDNDLQKIWNLIFGFDLTFVISYW